MRILGRGAAAAQRAESHKKTGKNKEALRGRSRTPKEGHVQHSFSSGGKQKKSRSRSGERSASSNGRRPVPVIDRIPTAISYHSEDSEDKLLVQCLEQKSKSSRYSDRYDPAEPLLSDEEDERDKEPAAAALTDENGDAEVKVEPEDRYEPVKKTKSSANKQSNKNKKQAAQIERLWSDESFETDRRMQQKIVSKKSSGSKDKYSKEGDRDPIYDSPKKKKSNAWGDDPSKKSRCTAESKARSRSSSKKERRSESRSKPRSKSPCSPRSTSSKQSSPRSTRSHSSRSTRSRSKSVSEKRSSSAKARGSTSNSHSSRRDKARGRSSSKGRSRSSGRSHSSRSTKRSHKSHSSRERRRSRRPGSTRSHSSRSTKRSNRSSSRERRRSHRPGSARSHSSRSSRRSNKSSSRERRHHSRSARSRSGRSPKQSSKSPRSDRHHRSRSKAKQPSRKARRSNNKHAQSKRREKPLEVVPPLEEVVSPQDSPAVGSETSSLTDPLRATLDYSVTDKVVKEIEQKLKLLKKAAAEEKAAAKRARKEAKKKRSSSKSEGAARESRSKKTGDSSSVKKLVGKKIPVEEMEQEPASPKDAVEMMRSESNSTEHEPDTAVHKAEKPKKKKKVDKITSKNESEVEVQEEQVTVEGTMDGQESLVPKSESQHAGESVNSAGRPFSKLLSKTKISVGAAGNGTGTASENATERVIKDRRREGGNWDSMYKKALFTPEDSTMAVPTPLYSAVAAPIPLSQPEEQVAPLPEKSEMQRYYMLAESMPRENGDKHKKKSNARKYARNKHEKKNLGNKTKDLVMKVAPAWKFGRKKSTAITSGPLKLVKSSSFWKKRKAKEHILEKSDFAPRRRRLESRKKKSPPLSVELNSIKADSDHQDHDDLQRRQPLVSPTKNNAVRELDEYSVANGVSDEPALVQCLKFYSCSTIAGTVDVAIKAANCRGAPTEVKSADVDDDDSCGHFVPATPQPAVEVVLDDLLLQHELTSESKSKGSHKSRSGSIRGRSILSCGDDNSWEEALGRNPSILIDVTDKHLHLDEDVSLDQKKPVKQQETPPLAMKRADISITSVRVPFVKNKKTEKMRPTKTKNQKKKSEKALFHQRVEKTKTTDEEEAVTEHNSSHSSHDNGMEEESAFLSEEELERKNAPHGRFRKLVGCFRKK